MIFQSYAAACIEIQIEGEQKTRRVVKVSVGRRSVRKDSVQQKKNNLPK